jgi:hypothetical protein
MNVAKLRTHEALRLVTLGVEEPLVLYLKLHGQRRLVVSITTRRRWTSVHASCENGGVTGTTGTALDEEWP